LASIGFTPSGSLSFLAAASHAPKYLRTLTLQREGVMLERLESSLSSFKPVSFKAGLNVLLAQKSPGATQRQTRNGVGKSSFVELVHFLFGGEASSSHFLRAEPRLAEASFSLRFGLATQPIEIERSPATGSWVVIKNGDPASWSRQPKLDKKSGHLVLSNADWRAVLGNKMFGLPDADEDDDGAHRFGPSFRSLFSYFARRQNSGGFSVPQQHSTKQQPYSQQVAVTYLLGLDAEIPRELEEVRQREKALGVLRKAAKEGALGEVVGKASDLRTKVLIQEARVARLREQLASFRVVPQYTEYEQEASRLTAKISALANDNSSDATLLAQLQEAVQSETPPRFADVKRAYEDANVVVPSLVQKRFEEVERFHRSIVENRRSHLRSEIDAAEERIRRRDREKLDLDARRAQVMAVLQSGGALEHFSELQAELARLEAQVESLRQRFEAAEMLERKSADLDVERARLHTRLQDDHREQRDVITQAILAFEALSNALYERAGSLTINDTPNGPSFDVKIEAARSKGINNMQIFCFDMMLMELCAKRGQSPGFLIHDSHLFDGVDARQRARALELGAERAGKLGFQYIVTMNEDEVPLGEFQRGFRFEDFLNPIRLTDATESGGLFGFRFD
jgi:uncharacterized protein YydD (DUF2326 family)